MTFNYPREIFSMKGTKYWKKIKFCVLLTHFSCLSNKKLAYITASLCFVEAWVVSQQDLAFIKSIISDIIIVLDKQGIIQKKSASCSQTLPCLLIFFWNFILFCKCQKWSFNKDRLVSATAIYQTRALLQF